MPSTFDDPLIEARPSDFELDRAISAYLPLLSACYALANQQPTAIPSGYDVIAEVRASLELEDLAAPADPPEVQEAVLNDAAAAASSVADPSAFGFVVREVASGAILVCMRGTQTPREWLTNFTAVPSPFNEVPGFGLVHLGFERMTRSVRASIQTALTGIDPGVRVTAVGHSLGGAMATLSVIDMKHNFGRTNVDLCTFGGPRVGKPDFRRNFNREIPRCFRVTNQFDIVPHVPSLLTGWVHVGDEIEVDGNVDNAHSLAAYLQGLRNIGSLREIDLSGAAIAADMAAARSAVLAMRTP
jgi:triacylglycerol lipase